jgi:chromosome segregation ATPase
MDTNSQTVTDIMNDNIHDTIIEDSANISQDITSFLNNAISKSKILNRSKLQIDLENCLNEINQYKATIANNKNIIDQLTRDKNMHMESNEKNKNEVQRLNILNATLNQQYETEKTAVNYEKNTNTNLRVAHEAQIQKHSTLNEQLNIKLNEHINQHNDLQLKYNDLQKRYSDLTTLYSKQTNEFELQKKNIKHVNDELNTALSNNLLLHDEITSTKSQTVQYLNKIEELTNAIALEKEKQKELHLLSLKAASNNTLQRSINTGINSGIPKSKITTNARGLRVTNR